MVSSEVSAESIDIRRRAPCEAVEEIWNRGRRCSLTVGEGSGLAVITNATAAYSGRTTVNSSGGRIGGLAIPVPPCPP